MTRSDNPDLARGWLHAEKLLDEEADRLATMSDEDFEREMDALPERDAAVKAETPADATGDGSGKHPVAAVVAGPVATGGVRARTRTATRWVALLTAAAVGTLVVLVVTNRPPATVGSSDPRLQAKALRDQALAACERASWAECERGLDEARALDPAGDADPRVQAARAAVVAGSWRDAGAGDGGRGEK